MSTAYPVILAILALISGIIGIFSETQNKRASGFARLTIWGWASAVSLVLFCVATILAEKTKRSEDAELSEKNTNFQKTIQDAFLASEADTTRIKAVLELRYRDVYKASEADAKSWATSFIASRERLKKDKASLLSESGALAQKLGNKWLPLREFYLRSLDSRIAELSKLPEFKILKSNEPPELFKVTAKYPGATVVKLLECPSGAKISIVFRPGTVFDGKFQGTATFDFISTTSQGAICSLQFTEDRAFLGAAQNHKSAIKDGYLDDDVISAENRHRIESALNHAFEHVFD